jgi:hypothetical protein
VDTPHDVIELHPSVRIPVPVQRKGRAFASTSVDITFIKIGHGKSCGDLPGPPTPTASPPVTREIVQGFDSAQDPKVPIPREIFSGQEIGGVPIAAVKPDIRPSIRLALHPGIDVFSSSLKRSTVENNLTR